MTSTRGAYAPLGGAHVAVPDDVPVTIPAGHAMLHGDLVVPVGASGLVLFAHGSGSSHLSPRNRHVASLLQHAGFATLLFDLLTRDEEAVDQYTASLRFDIPLLAARLVDATTWVASQPRVGALPRGYFGASTGAAAALVAAAVAPAEVAAVVSRGGRPDLADAYLPQVRAPTLLIVGELDPKVRVLNEDAAQQMVAPCETRIVAGATHLFEEPGTLDEVARLAIDWFHRHLRATPLA